jgi:hypothetical protein
MLRASIAPSTTAASTDPHATMSRVVRKILFDWDEGMTDPFDIG